MELWDELEKELLFLSTHLFIAHWQQEQFSHLHKNLPEESISLTIDFAENFTCFAQNEIQGAHWAQDSVTLHPCIARYRCNKCHEIIEEAIDIVSDDLNHDCHAAHTFLEKAIDHIKSQEVPIKHAYVISDGCAAQYKSKIPFMDISCCQEDFGIKMERCFYGSRHGKNRCDGEAGVGKQKARRAILSGQVVNDARSFFESVKKLEILPEDNMPCKHKLRKILFVESKDVERNRPLRDAKTLLGTRKVHSVRDCSSRGKLLTRRLSCFCEGCIQGNFEGCINTEYIDAWKPVLLKPLIPNTPVVNDIDNQTRDHGGRGVRTRGGRRVRGVRTRGGRGRQEGGQIRGGGGQGRQGLGQGRRGRGQGRQRIDGGHSSEESSDDPSSEESSDDPLVQMQSSEDARSKASIDESRGEELADDQGGAERADCLRDEERTHDQSHKESEDDQDELIFPSPEESLMDVSGLSGILDFLLEPDGQLSPVYQPHIPEDQSRIVEDQPHIIADEPYILEDQPYIPEDQPHIPEDQPHIPEDQPHIPEDQPHIPEDQPHIIADQPYITNDQPHILEDQPYIPEDQPHIIADQPHIPEDQSHILEDQLHILEDQPHISEDQLYISEDQPHISEDQFYIPEDQPHISEDQPRILEDQPHIPNDQPHIPNDQTHISEDQSRSSEDQFHISEDQPHILEDQPHIPEDQTQTSMQTHVTRDQPQIPKDLPQMTSSFSPGVYLSIKHGDTVFPAVVEKWPHVHFFVKKGAFWSQNSIVHTILITDVVDVLDPPSLKAVGSRFYYNFDNLQL